MQSELKPCYLLVKRGLYYAPDRHGYTGVKARAGRYREVDALGLDGVTAIHEDDAAEFSPACWQDTKEAVLRAEITRLTEALRAAEEREKGLREALGQLSSYVGTGIGDEGTTSEQFIKRITWGIDHISNAQLTFAAEIVEECSKIPQTTWGEVKQAILARQAPAGAKPC